MKHKIQLATLTVAFSLSSLVGCGSSFPPPAERLSSAESATRSANELGAAGIPNAALHARLAQEQIDQAKKLIADGENQKADFVLQRASSDAELAVLLAKENTAIVEAKKATEKVNQMKSGK